jgi:hypothetical protein
MACPNFVNGPKTGLRLLGVNHHESIYDYSISIFLMVEKSHYSCLIYETKNNSNLIYD